VTGRTAAVDFRPRRTLNRPDYILMAVMLALTVLGLLMIFSASAPRLEAEGVSRARQLIRQSVFVTGGLILFTITSLVSVRTWRMLTPYIYVGVNLLLLAVLSPIGALRQGAQRWISLGLFDVQPSELAKPAVILALALILTPVEENQMRWMRILKVGALVSLPAALIFMQPDLGTMLVFGFVTVVMLFIAGTTVRQLVTLLVAALIVLAIAVELDLLEAYQVERLTGFLNPAQGTLDVNYNQDQSQIAIGSGGMFGRGLFEGTQTNLAFVPAQTTDFIFTAVAEQLGFVGGAIVLGLYALLIWRMLAIASAARDRFGQLVAAGVAAMLGFHVFVNVGMTVGLLPVTGLPLPFMSFGGSFYVSMAVSTGIVHAVWIRRTKAPGDVHFL
jgi:rod shape determining protein RodA